MFGLPYCCHRRTVHVSVLMYCTAPGFAAIVSSIIRFPFRVPGAPVVKSTERKSFFTMKLAGSCWWASSALACPCSATASKRLCAVSFLPILAGLTPSFPLHMALAPSKTRIPDSSHGLDCCRRQAACPVVLSDCTLGPSCIKPFGGRPRPIEGYDLSAVHLAPSGLTTTLIFGYY